MDKEILKKIESFGDIFKQTYRDKLDKEKLLNDWKYSLEFFFEHSFMRGRKDTLSLKFLDATIKVLEKTIFENLDYDLTNLENQLKENGVNNGSDRVMVIESVKFIKKIQEFNITDYFIKKLKENQEEAYNELISIKFVGDKIATLYIRELCWLFDITLKDYKLIFPIDTWVKQIVNKLKMLNERVLSNEELKKVGELEVKEKAIKVCLENDINPIKFNAGVWYIGTHSLEILLDNLHKI